MTSKINYTLLAYQESYEHTYRNGDREAHEGSFAFHCSSNENEIIDLWSGYLFKNQGLASAEQEYEITLLQNGLQESQAPYPSTEYCDFDDNEARIKALSAVAITKHLDEKKRQDDLARERAEARKIEEARKYKEAVIAGERATYEALKVKYG